MKVYIATKFENQAQFHYLKGVLEENGHTITHDWTKESSEGLEYPVKYAYLQTCAARDYSGVIDADAIVFIPVHDKPMVGAYVELGMALASESPKRVIVVDAFNPAFPGKNNIFWFLPCIQHVKSIDEAAGALGYGCRYTLF